MNNLETLVKLLTIRPEYDGTFSPDVVQALDGMITTARYGLLALPMKVGGTFLRSAMVYLLEAHYMAFLERGKFAANEVPEDIYFPSLLMNKLRIHEPPMYAVMHLHVYPNPDNIGLIDAFRIPTILGSRNIFDTLVSYWDMNVPDNKPQDFFDPLLSKGPHISQLDIGTLRTNLVHQAPQWYAAYYGRWLEFNKRRAEMGFPEFPWLNHEQLRANPLETLQFVASRLDPEHVYSESDCQKILDKMAAEDDAKFRRNKQKKGRGADFFTVEEKDHITRVMLEGASEDDLSMLNVL